MLRHLAVLSALLLIGCASDQEAARQAYEARQAAHHRKCLEYGFQKGTLEYGLCRQRLDELYRQERAMTRGIVLQHWLLSQ